MKCERRDKERRIQYLPIEIITLDYSNQLMHENLANELQHETDSESITAESTQYPCRLF